MRGAELCAAHLGRARGPDAALTPEVIDALVAMLRAGNLVPVSARAAGIAKPTFYKWLAIAEQPNAPELYVELRERVERARAEGQVRLVAQIATQASTDWRAAAWLLARGTDEWALPSKVAEDESPIGRRVDPFAEVDELAAKRLARGATTPG